MAGFEDTNEQLWGTVIVGVTNVLATFIAIAFVDKFGPKPIMYAGFVTMGTALLTVGVSSFLAETSDDAQREGCHGGSHNP